MIRFPAAEKVHTAQYTKFKGVDFSTDAFLVDKDRSPWAPNLISDTGGMPEKRPGWRVLGDLEAPVYGIFRAVISGDTYLLVHAGGSIYQIDDEYLGTALISEINEGYSTSVFFDNALYIFTGAELLVFDGSTLEAVEGKIPEIVIGRTPSGGGTPLEDLNLIQPKFTESFLGTTSDTAYQLSYGGLEEDSVEVLVMDSEGDWDELTPGSDFTVDLLSGVVTFDDPPGVTPISGQDNIKITASHPIAGNAEKILNASVVTLYENCLFCAGSVKGTDFRSGFSDPTYWPDTGYDELGSDETDIMGYLPIGSKLAVVKEDNEQDTTVFLRGTATLDGETVFTKEPSIAGVGAIAKRCFGTLRGEPLFLSRQGVFALTSNALTSERIVQNRSKFIDFALTREANLENAVSIEYNGCFILAVNGRAYILDGRQDKAYNQQEYGYECAHWTNIPATCFLQEGDTLYFGTSTGKLCQFNHDIVTMDRYSDDGGPINASWATKADDDGDFMRVKFLQRAGSGMLIKPYTHTSALVYASTERDLRVQVASASMDIFDFAELDFARFTFSTSDRPQIVPLSNRVTRYKTLQFVIGNNELNEGFGVYGLIKRFQYGGYVHGDH